MAGELVNQPVVYVIDLFLRGAVAGVVGKDQPLGGRDDVVSGVRRRRRARFVVEAPRVESRRGDAPGKVHDVVVLRGEDLRLDAMSIRTFARAEHVGPATCTVVE